MPCVHLLLSAFILLCAFFHQVRIYKLVEWNRAAKCCTVLLRLSVEAIAEKTLILGTLASKKCQVIQRKVTNLATFEKLLLQYFSISDVLVAF